MNLVKSSILLFCVIIFRPGYAQELGAKRQTSLSIEYQQYPAGSIPQVMLELGLNSRSVINARIGYNFVRHGDLGKHDDERGGGVGFSVGYRKYLKDRGNCFLYSLRSDIWFNTVDWNNDSPKTSGTTKVTVFQPAGSIGYQLEISEVLTLTPTISVGAEINVSTRGESIGEGAIGLIGIEVGYRF